VEEEEEKHTIEESVEEYDQADPRESGAKHARADVSAPGSRLPRHASDDPAYQAESFPQVQSCCADGSYTRNNVYLLIVHAGGAACGGLRGGR
jgi:hypothetical protein